ncbi:MAG: hypothetical protein WCI71_09020 [Bacteroidota bacterium]
MAHSTENLLLAKFSGKIGNQFSIRHCNGRVILAKFPGSSSKKPSASQTEVRERFQAATRFAQSILRAPEYRELYAKRAVGGKTTYNVAIADYFTPPVVAEIDCSEYHGLAGDKIRVIAYDNIKVRMVTVSLRDAENKELEFGSCVEEKDGISWSYTVTADHTPYEGQQIKAVAYDIPGNTGAGTSTVW